MAIVSNNVNGGIIVIDMRIIKGPIFCHEDRINTIGHARPAITEGNQKCNGAIPILSNKLSRRNSFNINKI